MPIITPEVISISPNSGAIDIVLNPVILVEFNTDIASASLNTNTVTLNNGVADIPLIVLYHTLTRTAEIRTSVPLDPNTLYTLTIKGDDVVDETITGITDILGVPIAMTITSTFTTGVEEGTPYNPNPQPFPNPTDDTVTEAPLDIEAISPNINSYHVSSNKIVIKFSKPVDPTTITNENIFIVRRDNL